MISVELKERIDAQVPGYGITTPLLWLVVGALIDKCQRLGYAVYLPVGRVEVSAPFQTAEEGGYETVANRETSDLVSTIEVLVEALEVGGA